MSPSFAISLSMVLVKSSSFNSACIFSIVFKSCSLISPSEANSSIKSFTFWGTVGSCSNSYANLNFSWGEVDCNISDILLSILPLTWSNSLNTVLACEASNSGKVNIFLASSTSIPVISWICCAIWPIDCWYCLPVIWPFCHAAESWFTSAAKPENLPTSS